MTTDRTVKALLFALVLGVWTLIVLQCVDRAGEREYNVAEIHRRFTKVDGTLTRLDEDVTALRDRMEMGFRTVLEQATSNTTYLTAEILGSR